MPNYQIVTDSCCDLLPEMYDQLNLTLVPLTMEFQGKIVDDRSDDSLKEVYAPFGGEFMRTVLYYLNQCMIEPDAEDAWEKYKDAIYDAILEVVEYLES